MKFFENLFDPFTPANGPPPNTLFAFGRWLFAGAGPAVRLLGISSVLIGISEVVAAWSVGLIVERISTHGRDIYFDGFMWQLGAIVVFMLLLRPLFQIMQGGLTSLSLGPGLSVLGLLRLHKYTLGQSLDFFEDDFAGRINQKQIQTATAVGELLMETLTAIAFAASMLIGGALVLFASDIRLSLVMVVWFGLYILALRWGLPRIRTRGKIRAEARSAISGNFVDSIGNISTVKLFAHTDLESASATKVTARLRDAAVAFGRVVFNFRALVALLGGLLPVALVGTALVLWWQGASETGAIVTAAILASRLGAMTSWFSFMLMGVFANVGIAEDGIETLTKPYRLVDA